MKLLPTRLRWMTMVTLLTLAGLSIAACQRRLSPEEPCGFQQNTELRRVSWKVALPVRLFVHQSVPIMQHPEIESDLRAAAEAWNKALGKEVLRIEAYGVSGPLTPKRDGYSIVYWMSDWEPDRLQEQARTTIHWIGSQINEADVRINSRYQFNFGPNPPSGGVDFRSLMIHEFGHVLGLAHVEIEPSVMQKVLGFGVDRRSLGGVDVAHAKCEY